MRVGPWKKHIPPKDDTPEVRRYAFDLCWRSGKLCRAVSTSDICKQELIALVSEMYETLAECSELLDVDIISGVKEKMRLNKKKYDEEECRNQKEIIKRDGNLPLVSSDFEIVPWGTPPAIIGRNIQGWLEESLEFAKMRNFERFDSTENLAFAIFNEVGEFVELLQWKYDKIDGMHKIYTDDLYKLLFEMADICIYLVRFANTVNIVEEVRDMLLALDYGVLLNDESDEMVTN